MEISEARIKAWLAGQAPTAEEVAQAARELPWWTLPAAMRLRWGGADVAAAERAELSARLAVAAPDPEQMALAANCDLALDLAQFYPIETPATPDTDSTIEKFLSTYGTTSADEDAMLERLIFNPTPDYAQLLAREEELSAPAPDEAPAGSADALINSFILKSRAAAAGPPSEAPKPEAPVKKPAADTDATLSESLAQAYIKRGRYSKAYEIISNLNLNFPEKSIYFADQLRFLSKLMALEKQLQKQ